MLERTENYNKSTALEITAGGKLYNVVVDDERVGIEVLPQSSEASKVASQASDGYALISTLFLDTLTFSSSDPPNIERLLEARTSIDRTESVYEANLVARGLGPLSIRGGVGFHHPFRADEWLLYAQDSPSASGARGFARGLIFSRGGVLVASVAQEVSN